MQRRYLAMIDPKAQAYRAEILRGPVNDLAGVARPALHLSAEEHEYLERANPELSQEDAQLRAKAWLDFIHHPDSRPFRVQERI